GCGCTGDLATFPAAVKIALDPLLYVYQKLGLLIADRAGAPTVYLSLGAETLPLLDDLADLVICRNALDHMPKPELALAEIRRILKSDGSFFRERRYRRRAHARRADGVFTRKPGPADRRRFRYRRPGGQLSA